MPTYCVNAKPLENGVYEVHDLKCLFLPPKNRLRLLGEFNNCFGAVGKARTVYETSNGCYYCCKEAYYSDFEDERSAILRLRTSL